MATVPSLKNSLCAGLPVADEAKRTGLHPGSSPRQYCSKIQEGLGRFLGKDLPEGYVSGITSNGETGVGLGCMGRAISIAPSWVLVGPRVAFLGILKGSDAGPHSLT